ncbi:hypothetical protein Hanom_Chr14g01294051 [Helianthus anomalus]
MSHSAPSGSRTCISQEKCKSSTTLHHHAPQHDLLPSLPPTHSIFNFNLKFHCCAVTS